jgi:sugar phosphate isomerase/epimerase
MPTRTGNFHIGFRRGWTDWQKDLKGLAAWGKQAGFEAIDLGKTSADDVRTLQSNGLRLGSADLADFTSILAPDAGKRRELVQQNVAYVKDAAAAGARVFFTCILPTQPDKPRAENYKLAVEAYTPICQAIADTGATLAIEGYPGGGPWFAALCCTPETYRSFIKDVGVKGVGINYDPSHLIRLGIDPIRFLKEFAPHVYHVHAKDTEIFSEAVYEYGIYQHATFAKSHPYGEHVWRYTIPGHGQTRWTEAFKILKDTGFKGVVSVELEDENFNGSEQGEKAGFTHSLAFLRGV